MGGGWPRAGVNTTPLANGRGDPEIEIEFDSELGRVFVAREGATWRCSVQLAGQGTEGEGSLGADGERGAAYQCFEYLSHLLKHDNLFPGLLSDDNEEVVLPEEEPADQDPAGADAPGKARAGHGRKKRR